jgi:hypothetical protein
MEFPATDEMVYVANSQALPDPARYPDWQAFLLEVLKQSAASLREGHPEVPLDRLSWGEVSRRGPPTRFPPACPGWPISSICRAHRLCS